MNRFRTLGLVILLTIGLIASIHYRADAAATDDRQEQQNSASRVDEHMRLLTEKLDLTTEQQAKLKPIVQQMMDDRQKLMHDKSLSDAERHQKMNAVHESAIRQARQYLTDEQKKKLDQLESESHHGHTN